MKVNLYDNNEIKRKILFVNEFTYFTYFIIGKMFKFVHNRKKTCKNIDCDIGLYQRSVTDNRGHIYNSIAECIIVKMSALTPGPVCIKHLNLSMT